jgi:dUTP pyrophosphatase
MMMKTIPCQFINPHLSHDDRAILLPKRQSADASGFDLCSAHREDVVLLPMKRVLISTGIAIWLSPGFEGQVRSRSGLSFKNGIIALNAPGTIDADYRGEIKVILANFSEDSFTITFGMRIAQLVIAPISLACLEVTESLSDSARGDKGFGSTGLTP